MACGGRSSAGDEVDVDTADDEDEDEADADEEGDDGGGVSHFFSRLTRRARAAERKACVELGERGRFTGGVVGAAAAAVVGVAVPGLGACLGASLGDGGVPAGGGGGPVDATGGDCIGDDCAPLAIGGGVSG
jgi:hypothetical protein